MNTKIEMLDVVNEQDEVIGQDLKSSKIEKGFISRVAAVFLVVGLAAVPAAEEAPAVKTV